MEFKKILITGGAGFVGSNLALCLKRDFPDISVIVLDNLKRRGSELNVDRFRTVGVFFQHGDVRISEDLMAIGTVDLVIDCSAEPSVLAGVSESPMYVINTNLVGTINCIELARHHNAAFLFLSTSRVYPIAEMNRLNFEETATRFVLSKKQDQTGVSENGISESFPVGRVRSLYGATKLTAEILLQEYIANYGMRGVINRCGLISGPWQMGKFDQGVMVLWMARHIFKKKLTYIGYGGTGKQVRDFMHINDLYEAIKIQLENFDRYSGDVYNIGGGIENSLSLQEMTNFCANISGVTIPIGSVTENRPNDIPIYVSDCSKFKELSGWECSINAEKTFLDIYNWIVENRSILQPILDC